MVSVIKTEAYNILGHFSPLQIPLEYPNECACSQILNKQTKKV